MSREGNARRWQQLVGRAEPLRRGPWGARLILAAAAVLVLVGCVQGAKLPGMRGGPPGSDRRLFVRVVDDLRGGESYYSAITREQRLLKYPLRPLITVRLPTLAWVMAAAPSASVRSLALAALAIATFAAWLWRLRAYTATPLSFGLATLVLAAAYAPAFFYFGYALHELWAGELLALALALYSPRRWGASFAVAVCALSIRELAAPFFLAMGVLAWRDGRRREALAWALGIAGLGTALLVHARALAPFLESGDRPSPGWLGVGGWRLVLLQMKWNALLMTTPDWLAAVAAPLALLGLLSPQGPLADRLRLIVFGYTAAFLVLGRPDNSYWGLMTAPLWPIGLYFAADAVRNLACRAGLPARAKVVTALA